MRPLGAALVAVSLTLTALVALAAPASAHEASFEVGCSSVTFTAPNTVSADHQVTDPSGHPAMSSKGSGTFTVGPPLSWTENGTYTYNQNQQTGTGTYQLTFKASQDTCTTGTQVSSFTGTYTDPQGNPATQPETFTRQP